MDHFTIEELKTLAGCCNRELKFMRDIEECGVPTAIQQGAIAALRAKCIETASTLQKAEAAKAKENALKKVE